MVGVWDLLCAGFVDDNRRLSEMLRQVIGALQQGDGQAAKALAEQLDRDFGPHIEFQERYLYPEVERRDGEARATRLYDGNVQMIAVLIQLQQIGLTPTCSSILADRWLANICTGLEQVLACEPMLDYLRRLDTTRHGYLLKRRQALREKRRRWSQLHPIAGT